MPDNYLSFGHCSSGFQRPDFKTLCGHHVLDILVYLFGRAGAKAFSGCCFVFCGGRRGLRWVAHLAAVAFIIMTNWHCGLFSPTSASRSTLVQLSGIASMLNCAIPAVVYPLPRHGGLPRVLALVPHDSGSPSFAVAVTTVLVFLLGLPGLRSKVVFKSSARSAIAVLSECQLPKISHAKHC